MELGYVRTAEHRKLMAEKCRVASLKKWGDPEWREMALKALRSLERRRKLSEALKGRETPWLVGREVSEETKQKLRDAWKKRQSEPSYAEYLSKLGKNTKRHNRIRREKKRKIFAEKLVADKRFSYIKGCVDGDGWIVKRSVYLATIDEDWAIHYLSVLKDWSGVTPTLRVRQVPPYRDQFLVSMYNDFVADFIKENKPTVFFEFLKGFCDAEGSFPNNSRGNFISITNSNVVLLRKIKNFLSQHGITAYIYKKPMRNGQIGGRTIIARKQNYTLRIANNRGIFWFYKNIGFRVERKQKRLEEWAEWLLTRHKKKYLEKAGIMIGECVL